jgi:hypothetical protein
MAVDEVDLGAMEGALRALLSDVLLLPAVALGAPPFLVDCTKIVSADVGDDADDGDADDGDADDGDADDGDADDDVDATLSICECHAAGALLPSAGTLGPLPTPLPFPALFPIDLIFCSYLALARLLDTPEAAFNSSADRSWYCCIASE